MLKNANALNAFYFTMQMINFTLVPSQHRVIHVGCVTYLWLNILCIYKRLDLNNELFQK